jgi:hypothetical protein
MIVGHDRWHCSSFVLLYKEDSSLVGIWILAFDADAAGGHGAAGGVAEVEGKSFGKTGRQDVCGPYKMI